MKRACGGVPEMYRPHIAANFFDHKKPVVWRSVLRSAAPTYLPNQLNGRKAHERSRSCFEKQTKFNSKEHLSFFDSLFVTTTPDCYRFGSVSPALETDRQFFVSDCRDNAFYHGAAS
jgi:hypothetical protein